MNLHLPRKQLRINDFEVAEPNTALRQIKNPDALGFQFGRSTDTAIEPVLETLYNLLLQYKTFKTKLTDLNQLVADLIKPERAVETQFLL